MHTLILKKKKFASLVSVKYKTAIYGKPFVQIQQDLFIYLLRISQFFLQEYNKSTHEHDFFNAFLLL